MKNIYKDYLNRIESILDTGGIKKSEQFVTEQGDPFEPNKERVKEMNRTSKPLPSLMSLADNISIPKNFNQELGAHPDFVHLKYTYNTENHYIVSVFVDIKGSTNLFKRYSPKVVSLITNTIQVAAIHTYVLFGGYIQRLQGDGVFVYFGGKQVAKDESVRLALQASSTFTYFVKEDLKEIFEDHNVETIYTRVGVDFGDDDDVIWINSGEGSISEVTTCSLHTSLAPKMQGFATNNGIVVGENIVKKFNKGFFSPVSLRTKNESDRYIFRNDDKSFRYGQFDFNWMEYLRNQDFTYVGQNGQFLFKPSIPSHNANLLKPTAISNQPFMLG